MLRFQQHAPMQFEDPYATSFAFRRVLMTLLLVFGVIGGGLAAAAALDIPPMSALAEGSVSGDWTFAEPAADELRATAMQVCGAEALAASAVGTERELARAIQVETVADQYRSLEQAYNSRVRELVDAGISRPPGVASKALPLDLAKSSFCLRTEASLPLATPTPVLPELPPLAGWGQRVYRLSVAELDQYAAAAGWPNEPGWWPEMRAIVICESGGNIFAHNTSDPHGGSWGLAQLKGRYHFDRAGEDFEQRFDPVVNLRTALWLRTARGHFGGGGGWKLCSDLLGIQ
ncbi:MAG TPA: hypothetical protein PKD27_09430 [Tepidiformaceae bacterium]|nr:hypothetical protein [Tepidiformaceae bacterium]